MPGQSYQQVSNLPEVSNPQQASISQQVWMPQAPGPFDRFSSFQFQTGQSDVRPYFKSLEEVSILHKKPVCTYGTAGFGFIAPMKAEHCWLNEMDIPGTSSLTQKKEVPVWTLTANTTAIPRSALPSDIKVTWKERPQKQGLWKPNSKNKIRPSSKPLKSISLIIKDGGIRLVGNWEVLFKLMKKPTSGAEQKAWNQLDVSETVSYRGPWPSPPANARYDTNVFLFPSTDWSVSYENP